VLCHHVSFGRAALGEFAHTSSPGRRSGSESRRICKPSTHALRYAPDRGEALSFDWREAGEAQDALIVAIDDLAPVEETATA
jgi:hypothetical protein